MLGNILILAFASVAWFGRNLALQLLKIKQLWYFGTALVFIMCIGGTAYNMIHGVPNFRYAKDEASGNYYIDEYFQ